MGTGYRRPVSPSFRSSIWLQIQINEETHIPAASAADDGTTATPYSYAAGYEAIASCTSMRIEQWRTRIKGYMISDAAEYAI
jgi:hypothetical protein